LFEQRDRSSPLNFAQYAELPHSIEIVMWPEIAVMSLQPTYSDWRINEDEEAFENWVELLIENNEKSVGLFKSHQRTWVNDIWIYLLT